MWNNYLGFHAQAYRRDNFFLKKRKIDWLLFSNVHMHSQSGFASSCAREKHKILFKIFLYIKNKNKKEKKKMEPGL